MKSTTNVCQSLVLSLLIIEPAFAVSSQYQLVELGFLNDSNITNAGSYSDIKSSNSLNISYTKGQTFYQGSNSSATWEANTAADVYALYNKLNNIQLSGLINYLYKPNLSFSAPLYSLNVSYSQKWVNSAIRSGSSFIINANVSKRLNEKNTMVAGYTIVNRSAKTAFSKNKNIAYLGIEHLFSAKISFYGFYQYVNGKVTTTAKSTPALVSASYNKFEADDAFGATNQFAYLINAKTNVIDLGVNYAFSRSKTLNMGVRYKDSNVAYGNKYQGTEFFSNFNVVF